MDWTLTTPPFDRCPLQPVGAAPQPDEGVVGRRSTCDGSLTESQGSVPAAAWASSPRLVYTAMAAHYARSRTTASTAANAPRAVARSHFWPSLAARPGWIRLRKSFASRTRVAVSGLMMPRWAATSTYS